MKIYFCFLKVQVVPLWRGQGEVSRLPTADCQLPTPNSQLPTPDSRLPTPDSRLFAIFILPFRIHLNPENEQPALLRHL